MSKFIATLTVEVWEDANSTVLGIPEEHEYSSYEDLWAFCRDTKVIGNYERFDWILYCQGERGNNMYYNVYIHVRPV